MEFDFGPLLNTLINVGLRVIVALLIFAVGRWLAGVTARLVRRTLDQRGTDEAVARMVTTLTRLAVLLIAFAIALGTLGIETTALAALIAALGLAIGLALQGALANFAGGVLILTFHPFRIGDLVEISGSIGIIEDIQLVYTVLLTGDNSKVVIPNGQISNDKITNFSATGIRRVDLVFGIGYENDLHKAKGILTELVTADERVLAEPAPTIRVLELAGSSVNIAVRPFAKLEHYWDIYFDLTEQVKLRFDEEGISIPFPQQDVHLFQANGSA